MYLFIESDLSGIFECYSVFHNIQYTNAPIEKIKTVNYILYRCGKMPMNKLDNCLIVTVNLSFASNVQNFETFLC